MLLAGCGGGQSRPASPPAPPVAPAPTPAPIVDFAAERARATSALAANAVAAYDAGATGDGVKIGIVDTGIAAALPEFAGRIDGASRDLVGTRGLVDTQGHGTAVSSVALAARDGIGMHGVAPRATLLSLNASDIGCSPADCGLSDGAIAAGILQSAAAGARVINLSLGSDNASEGVLQAVRTAAAAGAVIVVAAGNQSAADPRASARAIAAAAPDAVIVAGGHDTAGTISAISNRAGSAAGSFLLALGEDVRVTALDGTVAVRSGTSLATAAVSGAAALLAQAFPNLTNAQIVRLLLASATDGGAGGTDPVYGRGALNLARAFAPSGTLTAAATRTAVAGAASMAMSPAMGDATVPVPRMMIDADGRVYTATMNVGIPAPPDRVLAGAVQLVRAADATVGPASFNMLVPVVAPGRAFRAENRSSRPGGPVTMRVTLSVGPGFTASFVEGAGIEALASRLLPATPLSAVGAHFIGGMRVTSRGASIGHRRGQWTIGLAADHVRAADRLGEAARDRRAVIVHGSIGPVALAGGLKHEEERGAMLGGVMRSAAAAGATSIFSDIELSVSPFAQLRVGGGYTYGRTRPRAAGEILGGELVSHAWSGTIAGWGLLTADDMLAVRVGQPRRVSDGAIDLAVATGFDYGRQEAIVGRRRIALTPRGRELDLDLGYTRTLPTGTARLAAFVRRQPGHRIASAPDAGGMLTWSTGF